MRILITGFEAFGGQDINPSREVLNLIPDELDHRCSGGKVEIFKITIPTTIGESMEVIRNAVERYRPDVVLSIGQAGGRADITLEAVGANEADFPIPDNKGNMPRGEKIYEDAPDAYFTSIPNKRIVAGILAKGIPASISRSAGTYVCNYVCYAVCDYLRRNYPNARSGFMHVPYLPEQVAKLYESGRTAPQPSMSLGVMLDAVMSAIMTIYRCGEEKISGKSAERSEIRFEEESEGEERDKRITGSTH